MTTTPRVIWQNGQPRSIQFDDIYFSRESGLEETRHVFLQHNNLYTRWQNLATPCFTIAETGFGSGLNFLCTWQAWHQYAPPDARLHFVSTEKYPLSTAELQQIHRLWPELQPWSEKLLSEYHSLYPGWQRMSFDRHRVHLTLLIGDATTQLQQLNACVDAWFLDGFAPRKNPDLWQLALFREMARLASPGSTFATFSCARAVSQGLQDAGFYTEKVTGFGTKRQMLRGYYQNSKNRIPEPVRSAIVVGGGIAGTSSAHSLAQRGWDVTLIERHHTLAQAASGNPQAMLYPRLAKFDIPLSRLALTGFLHSYRLCQSMLDEHSWHPCGMLQLAATQRERERCANVLTRNLPTDLVTAISATEASQQAGVLLQHEGLWLPRAGWVKPGYWCQTLATQTNIRLCYQTEILDLRRQHDGWSVWCQQNCIAEAAVVILCNAQDSCIFPHTAHIPLQPVRGQITRFQANAKSLQLRTILCSDGYISPSDQGWHTLGATFTPDETNLALNPQDHRQNLQTLKQMCPDLYQSVQAVPLHDLGGHVAFRCTTPDYLPVAGPILDASKLTTITRRPQISWFPGLYVNAGHGSKGFISAPLCAEVIAAMLEHEPLPVDRSLAQALDPNRFALRRYGLKKLVGTAYE